MSEVPEALVESVRAELLKLVQGDLDKNFVAIGKLSARARDLFMVLKNPEAAVKGRKNVYQLSSEDDYGDSDSGVSVSSSGGIIMANPSGSAETFGAKAIREIIGALPSVLNAQNETPSSLIIAASIARDRGMTDLSAALEKKLLGHALDGERPIDKERMRDLAGVGVPPSPEALKGRYLGAAAGAVAVAINGSPPPPNTSEDDVDDE